MSSATVAALPRENPALFGQDAAARTLRDAAWSDRLPHAWLLTGPYGVGKATLAFRFARWILAGGPEAERGGAGGEGAGAPLWLAPEHPVSRRVAAGSHADLLHVDRGVSDRTGTLRSGITVSETRPVRDFLHLTAAEGGWRVVIIDNADLLHREAANALLKPVEEPSSNTLIFIISQTPGRLLPTIRSRCRRLHLPALGDADLDRALAAQRPDLPAAELPALRRLSRGSPGRAFDLLEQDGLALYRDLLARVGQLPKLDGGSLHAFCDRLARPAAEPSYRLARELMLDVLARALRLSATGAAAPCAAGEIEEGEVVALARRLPRGRASSRLWEEIGGLFRQADQANLDRKQVLLNAFLTLAAAVRSE